jgi:MinD-like ATPase involved in chromosome partitioning or flagellar assembly
MSTLTALWHWLLGGAPRPTAARHVVLVAGGARGVGTSLATALIGSAAAVTGRSVLLVEGAEAGLGDILGANAASAATDAELPVTDSGDDLPLFSVAPGVALLPASTLAVPAARAARLRRMVARCAMFDLVLIDAGARLAMVRELCAALGDMPRHGDRLLAITTPEPAHTASAYALIKSVLTRAPRARVDILVNRADPALAATIASRIQEGAHRFLRRPVGFAGNLPEDAALRTALAAGVPLPDAQGDAATTMAAHEALGRLLHAAGRTVSPSAPHQMHQLQQA